MIQKPRSGALTGEIQLIYIHLHYVMYSEEFRKYQALILHFRILILGKQRFQMSMLAFSLVSETQMWLQTF